MTAQEVAKMLGISVSALHRLCMRGSVPSVWVAGRRMFRREAIEAYLRDPKAQRRRGGRSAITLGTATLTVDEAIEVAKAASKKSGGDRS